MTGEAEQPLENFSKRAVSKDGLSYSCKACERVTAKKSYKGKKKKVREKKYYQANREHLLELSKKNYQENREARLAQSEEYRKVNPQVWRCADKRRRDKLKSVEHIPYTRAEIIARDSLDGIPICQICGKPIKQGEPIHIDHIVPLEKHGPDTPANVRTTHKHCNLRRPKDGRDEKGGR